MYILGELSSNFYGTYKSGILKGWKASSRENFFINKIKAEIHMEYGVVPQL